MTKSPSRLLNVVGWEVDLATRLLESTGWTVRTIITKPPQGNYNAGWRVVREKMLANNVVELVVASKVPSKVVDG